MKRKLSLMLMVFLIAALLFGGCSSASPSTTAAPTSASETAVPTTEPTATAGADSTTEKTRTITDMVGREMVVPETITRVGYNANQFTTLTVLGAEDLTCVAGSGAFDFLKRFTDRFDSLQFLTFDGNPPDTEIVLSAKPDIFFLRATSADDERIAPLEAAGITVFVEYGHVEDSIIPHVRSIANALGDQKYKDAAESYVDYFTSIKNDVVSRTAGIADKDKPTVMLFWPREDGSYGVTCASHITGQAITIAGGKVVGDLDAVTDVDVEQVIKWNPDVMIVMDTKDVYDEVIARPELQNLSAIKNGRVYCQPTFVQQPYTEEFPVFQRWLAKTLYPDLFKDVDFKSDMKEFASKFYRIDITDDQLALMEQGTDIPFKK